jgi:hypothetical protein
VIEQGRGKNNGDHCTQRVILEIYDAMAEFQRTGQRSKPA